MTRPTLCCPVRPAKPDVQDLSVGEESAGTTTSPHNAHDDGKVITLHGTGKSLFDTLPGMDVAWALFTSHEYAEEAQSAQHTQQGNYQPGSLSGVPREGSTRACTSSRTGTRAA